MWSLREQIEETFGPGVDLSGGLRKSFFAPLYLDHPELYPYRDKGGISLKKTLQGWRWPEESDYQRLDDRPEKQDTAYAESLQGVTHCEDRCWVFSQDPKKVQGQLVAVDVRADLDDPPPSMTVVMTETVRPFSGNDHFCDLSYDRGLLAVPNHNNEPNIIAFYRVDFDSNSPSDNRYYKPKFFFLGAADLKEPQDEGDASISWGVLYPESVCESFQNRIFISSFFREYPTIAPVDGQAGQNFFIYKVNSSGAAPFLETQPPATKFPLPFLVKNGTSLDLRRIQGGTISEAGHLYVSCDLAINEAAGGGVHGFDLVTGRRIIHLPVDGNKKRAVGKSRVYELEGLTTWDVDALPYSHASSSGQIHLTVLKPRLRDRDQVWVLHWRVPFTKRNLV